MAPWAWMATEWVCAWGKRCPELLKRSGGGQRTSSPVEFCAVPRPGSDAWRSRRGSELRPHIYLWEQRAAAIDQLWKRGCYDPTQHQTICNSKASDTQLTTNTGPNVFKIQMYTNTDVNPMFKVHSALQMFEGMCHRTESHRHNDLLKYHFHIYAQVTCHFGLMKWRLNQMGTILLFINLHRIMIDLMCIMIIFLKSWWCFSLVHCKKIDFRKLNLIYGGLSNWSVQCIWQLKSLNFEK